jgi:hypothetical protein
MTPAAYAWLTILFAVAVTDVALWLSGNKTLSKVTWEASKKYPVIPFLGGLLAGHLFWR